MKNLTIKTSTNLYEIFIGKNILYKINEFTHSYDKILLLTNKSIGSIYSKEIDLLLTNNNILKYEIEDGENYKTLESSMEITSFLIKNNFSRKSLIICFGGGVICDLGGFVASIFMRGIDFLQVPTSLLAQVDASIGGKVAVNHPLGKNLIGSFKQPIGVIIDINFLKTLPKKEFQSGMGEIIKHSLLSTNKDYFNFLFSNHEEINNLNKDLIIQMIFESCKIKKYFVEEDEFENGNRALLNLGHTYGHTLETLFNYENISHGLSVSKGIMFELYISKELGFLDDNYIQSVKTLFDIYNIDSTPIFIEKTALINTMKTDKKNSNNSINFIIRQNNNFVNIPVNEDVILKINSIFKARFIKGVIDIGTNSCRLFIAEVEKDENNNINIITPLYKGLQVSRLGKNLNQTGILCKESIEKTYSIIKDFKAKATSMGVSQLMSFATAATREASNGNTFVQGIKTQFDINTTIIPGEIEAKLSFKGNSIIYREKITTIDVGGGSTEVTIGDSNDIDFIKSFPIGVVKLTEMFFNNQEYTKENIESAYNYLRGFFKELNKFNHLDFRMIGVAGSVTTNVTVIKELPIFKESAVNGFILSKLDLENNLNLFLSKNLEERKSIVGLDSQRADVIISGNIILLVLLEILSKNTITVSTIDNLEGAMTLNI